MRRADVLSKKFLVKNTGDGYLLGYRSRDVFHELWVFNKYVIGQPIVGFVHVPYYEFCPVVRDSMCIGGDRWVVCRAEDVLLERSEVKVLLDIPVNGSLSDDLVKASIPGTAKSYHLVATVDG